MLIFIVLIYFSSETPTFFQNTCAIFIPEYPILWYFHRISSLQRDIFRYYEHDNHMQT